MESAYVYETVVVQKSTFFYAGSPTYGRSTPSPTSPAPAPHIRLQRKPAHPHLRPSPHPAPASPADIPRVPGAWYDDEQPEPLPPVRPAQRGRMSSSPSWDADSLPHHPLPPYYQPPQPERAPSSSSSWDPDGLPHHPLPPYFRPKAARFVRKPVRGAFDPPHGLAPAPARAPAPEDMPGCWPRKPCLKRTPVWGAFDAPPPAPERERAWRRVVDEWEPPQVYGSPQGQRRVPDGPVVPWKGVTKVKERRRSVWRRRLARVFCFC